MDIAEILTYPDTPANTKSPQRMSDDSSLAKVISVMANEQTDSVILCNEDQSRTLTAWQALQGVAQMLPYSDEYSDIQLSCPAHLYSASALTLAAEDADAPVISLLAYPAEPGMLNIYMRINRTDPSQAVRSLERHGFNVTRASGPENIDEQISRERLLELQHYLNI